MFLLMILMNLTLMFLLTTHPLAMGLTLLMQALLMALITGTLSPSFWFSYILFIIMVGGMMVLFIYMTSVASNKKFKFNPIMLTTTLMMGVISCLSMMTEKTLILSKNMIESTLLTNWEISSMLNKFLSLPSNWTYILIINYLLITLIAVVKISDIYYGPLRKIK